MLLKVRNAIKSFILCVDLKTMLLPLTLLSIKKLIIQFKNVLRTLTEPNLTEAEDINKRWQEHRRTIQKKSS